MHFIDTVTIQVHAGDGGNGKVSFRHEKFIDKGGPDGGDAGHGGNVIFTASRNQDTLANFRYLKEVHSDSGGDGGPRRRHGRNGADLRVAVPVGTVIHAADNAVLADLITDGAEAIIAKGGRGGYGNAHFVSSVRQAPAFAEQGEVGQIFDVQLELKMIADVGLVGLPNAGKSTLLARISNARPEIADYPFTTLTPNLGVVDIDGSGLLFADIPGLIEGAADGKGLGHEFLRHIERTAVLVHLIDAYQDDVVAAYTTIQHELEAYGSSLVEHPQVVVLNKVEGLDAEIVADLKSQLRKVVPMQVQLHAISGASGAGIPELLRYLKTVAADAKPPKSETEAVPVLTLTVDPSAWRVTKTASGFTVKGDKIEQFAARTDFANEEGVQRLRDIMRKMGILQQLVRMGIEADEVITIGTKHTMVY